MEGRGDTVPFFQEKLKSIDPVYVTFFLQVCQIFKILLERRVFWVNWIRAITIVRV